MAIRQSILAMYGAVSEGLDELGGGFRSDSAETVALRKMARELVGLTGSAGERGWYAELLRYFDTKRLGSARVTAPEMDEVRADLESDALTLHPTWASRAIAAASVLDHLSEAGVRRFRGEPRFLPAVLAAAPSAGAGPDDIRRVGRQAAEEITDRLMGKGPAGGGDYWETLTSFAPTLSHAAATPRMTARLRKVKREYCSVVTTTAEWPDVDYTRLRRVIEPSNWDDYYQLFFCEMTELGTNAEGWTRIHEAVSGDCSRYRLDTGLKFWKRERPGGLFINYDLDTDSGNTDKLVLVDNGYIWITQLDPDRPDNGVRVRTSKQLLISGMSATAMTVLAESLGYATNATDMFRYALDYAGPPLNDFMPSQGAAPPVPDTSPTWPVLVPEFPADLRDEFCADTTRLIKGRLDDAYDFGADYAARWENGIDLDDFDHLNGRFAEMAKTAAKESFDAATENFRPKTPTP